MAESHNSTNDDVHNNKCQFDIIIDNIMRVNVTVRDM